MMKRMIFHAMVIVVLVLLADGCGEESPVDADTSDPWGQTGINIVDYFPLKVGNTWTYQWLYDGDLAREPTKHIVKETISIDGREYFKVVTSTDEFGENTVGTCYAYSANRVIWRTPDGDIITHLEAQMVVDRGNVKVPAGAFQCVKMQRGPLTDPTYEWYAKGVGLVKADYGSVVVTVDSPEPIGEVHLTCVLLDYNLK